MAEQLPADLLAEILCRLPVKTMLSFKLVSKLWCTIISNVCVPRISGTVQPTGFLFCGSMTSPLSGCELYSCYASFTRDGERLEKEFMDSYSKLLPFAPYPLDLLDCCSGLLLFIRRENYQYYVCNPTTKQCIAIPKGRRGIDPISDASLAFDPCKSPQYKVVHFSYAKVHSVANPPRLLIFSSETGKWTRHSVPIDPPVVYGAAWVRRAVYLDGVLYKLSLSKHLLCFDLNALVGRAVELPLGDETDCFGFIGVSKGRFYYANHDSSRLKFLFWLLDDNQRGGYSWVLRHCISIHDIMSKNPTAGQSLYFDRNSSLCKPYAMHPTADIIFLGTPDMVLSYHLEHNKVEVVFTKFWRQEVAVGQYTVFLYPPCYVTLNGPGNGHREMADLHFCSSTRHWVVTTAKPRKPMGATMRKLCMALSGLFVSPQILSELEAPLSLNENREHVKNLIKKYMGRAV